MKREGFQRILNSQELTEAEKVYIKGVLFRLGGSFTLALFEAIATADLWNRARLAQGFPEEVNAYIAWVEGDLFDRACAIAGGDCSFIECEPGETLE